MLCRRSSIYCRMDGEDGKNEVGEARGDGGSLQRAGEPPLTSRSRWGESVLMKRYGLSAGSTFFFQDLGNAAQTFHRDETITTSLLINMMSHHQIS